MNTAYRLKKIKGHTVTFMVSELQRERKYVLGMRNIEYTFPNSKIT
jgi:hypothetical protein